MIRLHGGDSIVGVPVYLPDDPAIPAAEVPATATFERDFIADSELLQREQLDDVPGWTKLVGYGVVGGIVAMILGLLAWILTRLARAYSGPRPPRPARQGGGSAAHRAQRWPRVILLAHHPLLASLPFVVPVLALTAGVIVLAVRERRRRARG